MNEPQTITVDCQICHQPMAVRYVPTGLPAIDGNLLSMTGMLVHDDCINSRERQRTEAEEVARLEKRGNDFAQLCPAQYRDSDKWIATTTEPRLHRASIRSALAWEYGSKGLTMHGRTSGTGKTTSAWIICKREALAGKFIVAITHKELSDKATWAAKEVTVEAKQWARLVKSCDLLFIDDLGKSRFRSMSGDGRASEEFLFDVVDFRCAQRLPIIFTVNMTGVELRAAMSADRGGPFTRRLQEFFTSVCFDKAPQR